MDARQRPGSKGDFRLSASTEQIYRRRSQSRAASARSDDATLMKKSNERLVGEGSLSEEGQISSGTRTPGPKDGHSRSVFSSFIDGVRSLASRLSEKAGLP